MISIIEFIKMIKSKLTIKLLHNLKLKIAFIVISSILYHIYYLNSIKYNRIIYNRRNNQQIFQSFSGDNIDKKDKRPYE